MSAVVVRPAEPDDAEAIAAVCAAGWRDTYSGIYDAGTIDSVVAEYYAPERIRSEIVAPEGWDGWLVAVDDGVVVGAGGGGMTDDGVGEVFVLYLDPPARGRGIGTLLLDAITEQQRARGAREQWVSVAPENEKGLPFYRARGFEVRDSRPAWGVPGADGRVSLRLARSLD